MLSSKNSSQNSVLNSHRRSRSQSIIIIFIICVDIGTSNTVKQSKSERKGGRMITMKGKGGRATGSSQ